MFQAKTPHSLRVIQRPVLAQVFQQVLQLRVKLRRAQGLIPSKPLHRDPAILKSPPQAPHVRLLLQLACEQRGDVIFLRLEKQVGFTAHGSCSPFAL